MDFALRLSMIFWSALPLGSSFSFSRHGLTFRWLLRWKSAVGLPSVNGCIWQFSSLLDLLVVVNFTKHLPSFRSFLPYPVFFHFQTTFCATRPTSPQQLTALVCVVREEFVFRENHDSLFFILCCVSLYLLFFFPFFLPPILRSRSPVFYISYYFSPHLSSPLSSHFHLFGSGHLIVPFFSFLSPPLSSLLLFFGSPRKVSLWFSFPSPPTTFPFLPYYLTLPVKIPLCPPDSFSKQSFAQYPSPSICRLHPPWSLFPLFFPFCFPLPFDLPAFLSLKGYALRYGDRLCCSFSRSLSFPISLPSVAMFILFWQHPTPVLFRGFLPSRSSCPGFGLFSASILFFFVPAPFTQKTLTEFFGPCSYPTGLFWIPMDPPSTLTAPPPPISPTIFKDSRWYPLSAKAFHEVPQCPPSLLLLCAF